ncbi:ABC transporter permease subunit [Fictibacillus barbaricus]|uniref:ABC-type dipeptide/oligopeptide/nickel transport system permease component n=1 Tax=Fictibacillus barbaricus TaxID=182136 RepID=A0ABU1TW58_9BACL|nr:ABC transporter permease subunit [Fictibacillus barbaricus]MDR7071438.1 ABC-type dipeptide/oligopeptide/nickel transport system permease component [Fictibacillus barbaricus]
MFLTVLKRACFFLLPIVGVFFIGALPYLFFSNVRAIEGVTRLLEMGVIKNALFLNQDLGIFFTPYIEKIWLLMVKLFTFSNVEYYEHQQMKYMFPTILPYFYYSLKLVIGAFFLAAASSVLLALIVKILPANIQKVIRFFFFSLESLPDIFIVVMAQYLVILLYRKTGELLLPIVFTNQEPAYLMPIVCLAILPTLFLTRTLLFLLDDEDSKTYVEFARAKGIKYSIVLYIHMLRNSLISLFFYTKNVYWLLISGLFMVEYVMYIPGITKFMLNNGPTTPDVITVSIMLMFLPFYILFTMISYILEKKISRTEEEVA